MDKIITLFKRNKISVLITCFAIVYVLFSVSFFTYAFEQRDRISAQYEQAMVLFEEGNYEQALDIFISIQNYRDVENFICESKYNIAIHEFESQNYEEAQIIFAELGDYEDSEIYLAQIDIENIEESKAKVYDKALTYFEVENYKEALVLFETIFDYKDAIKRAEECELQMTRRNLNNALAAGVRTSVAISNDGSVVAVGGNSEGQCNVDMWKNIVSVDTYGCFTIGLTEDGRVELAGVYDGKNVNVSEWSDIIDVAAGERFIVGLKSDGTVIADGHNKDKQIEVDLWKDVIAIDAGWRFTVALTEDKELMFAGFYNEQKDEYESQKEKWSDVVNISASGGGRNGRGGGHTVGLKTDGTVVAIGDNEFGQCNVSEWTDIVKVATGDWYTVGLRKDGTVLMTGENESGYKYIEYEALESCTDIVDIAAGYGHTLCLHKDGTVTAFGFDDDGKCSKTVDWKNIRVYEY